MSRRAGLAAVGAALAAAGASLAASPGGPGQSWYVIEAQRGPAIGYVSETVAAAADGGREIADLQEIGFNEPGSGTTRIEQRTLRREDASGRTTFLSSTTTTGASWTRNEARIEADRAELVHATRNNQRTVVVALPPGVRFDAGEGLYPAWDPAAAPSLEFDMFNLDGLSVEHVVVTAGSRRDDDPAGARVAVRRRFADGQLVSIARLALGPDGRVLTDSQPMFGARIVFRASDRETATRRRPLFRLLPTEFLPSPYRISAAAGRGHIRFRFGFRDGLSFSVPQTGQQAVRADAEGVVIDICATCGPGLPTDAASLAAARRPAPWLQSDDPRIRALAAPVARMRLSDARKMALLAAVTARRLPTVDFVGHYSALDAMMRGAGDCTETAVLLAALGRAAGIPTKVANGLVYSADRFEGVGNVFIPHSWVLAWVGGAWRSYDAALPTGFDATHIALLIGDGDARSIAASGQLVSLLDWKDMAEIRPRPPS